MSATHDDEDDKVVSLRIAESDLDAFTKALRQAQADGLVPVNMSRSEAIRQSMQAVADDPSLLAEADDE